MHWSCTVLSTSINTISKKKVPDCGCHYLWLPLHRYASHKVSLPLYFDRIFLSCLPGEWSHLSIVLGLWHSVAGVVLEVRCLYVDIENPSLLVWFSLMFLPFTHVFLSSHIPFFISSVTFTKSRFYLVSAGSWAVVPVKSPLVWICIQLVDCPGLANSVFFVYNV